MPSGARANLRLRQQPKRDDAPNAVEVTNVEVLNRIRSLVAPPVPRVGLGAFGHAVDDAEEVDSYILDVSSTRRRGGGAAAAAAVAAGDGGRVYGRGIGI